MVVDNFAAVDSWGCRRSGGVADGVLGVDAVWMEGLLWLFGAGLAEGWSLGVLCAFGSAELPRCQ